MGAPAASQAAIRRALEAAKECGLQIAGYTVSKDGTITVTTAQAMDSAKEAGQVVKPKQWAKR